MSTVTLTTAATTTTATSPFPSSSQVAANLSTHEIGSAGDSSAPVGFQATDVDAATGVVLIKSEKMPADTPTVNGYDFNQGVDYDALFNSYRNTGFQATNLALAIDEINRMIKWRMSDEPLPAGETEADQPVDRTKVKCTIFLAYTSNMVSSGLREVIRYLAQHKMVDAIITTCGGIEEDIMKCFSKHYMGDFKLDGKNLRQRGLNRIGNLIVPNLNYVQFEEFLNPILDQVLKEQEEKKKIWSPSLLIERLGKEINNEESILYWCWKNRIPVFSPAITDGSIGDMIFFHGSSRPPTERIRLDIVTDIHRLNDMALLADHSGMIILGGGLVKHHLCNANLMRNGADFSVYVNCGVEYDGSDAGASPDEAVSWGKIRMDAKPVKVWGEATYLFPIIVAQTFVKNHDNSPSRKKKLKDEAEKKTPEQK